MGCSHPNDYQSWCLHGNTLDNLERYEEALVSIDKSIAINHDDHQPWQLRGVILNNLERYEEALISIDKSITNNSDDYQSWQLRGVTLDNLKRYEEALVSFDKSIAINPKDHQSWRLHGVVLDNLKRYKDALASVDKSIAINPDDHQSWQLRSVVLEKLERYEDALASVDKSITINPDDHRSWYLHSSILETLKRYEEALASIDKAITINPKFTPSYHILARIYHLQGKKDVAISRLNRAIKSRIIDDSTTWNNLGFLYLIKNKLELARKCFNHSLQKKSNQFHPIFNFALACARQKRFNSIKFRASEKRFKLIKKLTERSLSVCDNDTIQDNLYIALCEIILGKEQEGLGRIQTTLKDIQSGSIDHHLRCGILESTEILAYSAYFSGMDKALEMFQQALLNNTDLT